MHQAEPSKKSDKVAIFIDAANIWAAQKIRGRMIDYQKFVQVVEREFQTDVVAVNYYTAYPAEGTRSYSLDSKHKFYTYLEKALRFRVIKKALKQIVTHEENGELKIEKGNMDVEITIDAIHQMNNYDTAILCSGDSDFLPLVTYLRNHGKRVIIISSKNNISHELKTGGNKYIDLLKIQGNIWGKELKYRDAK
jgi:uncharacterized LabA/DUF88 family protein